MISRELRIGNLIMLPSKENKIYEIADGHDIDEFEGSNDGEPIPLTEEWLIKLGLKLDSVSNFKCAYNEIARLDKLYSNNIYESESVNNVD